MSIASAPASEAAELSVFVSHLVRRSQQRAVDLFAKAVGTDGLTHQQFILLLAVEQNPGTTQTRLVQVTGIDRSTLTDMIGRLGARGFLKRKTALHDKRANEVSITAKGRKALQAAMPAAVAADQAFIQDLPSAKRSAFVDALKALSNATEVEPEVPTRPRARRRTVRVS